MAKRTAPEPQKLKGYTPPSVTETEKSVPHYVVGDELFLSKPKAKRAAKLAGAEVVDSNEVITVYEVGDDASAVKALENFSAGYNLFDYVEDEGVTTLSGVKNL